jgi:hypothetical protein
VVERGVEGDASTALPASVYCLSRPPLSIQSAHDEHGTRYTYSCLLEPYITFFSQHPRLPARGRDLAIWSFGSTLAGCLAPPRAERERDVSRSRASLARQVAFNRSCVRGRTQPLTFSLLEPPLEERTLPSYFHDHLLPSFSDRPALVCKGESARPFSGPARSAQGKHLHWTFRDLDEHVVALAKGLLGAGVGKGDRVGVIMGNNRCVPQSRRMSEMADLIDVARMRRSNGLAPESAPCW